MILQNICLYGENYFLPPSVGDEIVKFSIFHLGRGRGTMHAIIWPYNQIYSETKLLLQVLQLQSYVSFHENKSDFYYGMLSTINIRN